MTEPHPPPASPQSSTDPSASVVSIMATLRGPDGCPWDREQTSESLKPYLLEEVYEVLEALDTGQPPAIKEELGDLLLQILFHCQIASEQNHFSFEDVVATLRDKLIRRHPHVFEREGPQATVTTSHEVLRQWDQLKQQEKPQASSASSILDGVPKTSPALQRALQVQKRASRVGFDWRTIEPVLEKFKEELDELHQATKDWSASSDGPITAQWSSDQRKTIEGELGDAFFALVNVSRFLKVNPEEALRKATNKFMDRFQYVEKQAVSEGKTIQDCPPEQLDIWWEAAKDHLQPAPKPTNTAKGAGP